MAETGNRWDKFYQKLQLIFNGIIASSMIPFALVFLEIQKGPAQPILDGEQSILKAGLLIATILMIIIATKWWQKWLQDVKSAEGISEKLVQYLVQKTKHLAMLESAAFISLAGYYLLKSDIFAFAYVGVLVVFSIYRPSFKRVCREINETEQDVVRWSNDPN